MRTALVRGDLNHTDNTFVTLTPADDDATWYASVSLLDEGTYEVERRDLHRGEHEVTTETVAGITASPDSSCRPMTATRPPVRSYARNLPLSVLVNAALDRRR